MGVIAPTATQVAPAFLEKAEIYDFIAVEAITAGQAVYVDSNGKAGLADADNAGHFQFSGIALNKAAAGRVVSVLKKGHVYGFAVSGLNCDVPLYVSNTAGAIEDGAGGTSVIVGRVQALTDKAGTKVLYIDADWVRTWA